MRKPGDVYHKEHEYHKCTFKYSETPPYGHLVITATFFGHLAKRPYCKNPLVNTVTS